MKKEKETLNSQDINDLLDLAIITIFLVATIISVSRMY